MKGKIHKGWVWTLLLLCVGVSGVRAQRVAVKTDALYWAVATPNLAFDAVVSPKWTLGLSAGYNPFGFSGNKKWKHVLVAPEARYWLCAPYAGHFVGANLVYSHYNAGNVHLPFGLFPELRDHRFQGDLGAVGVIYGYSWMLGRRWSVEAALGLGAGVTHYGKYLCEVCGSRVGETTRWLFMPTKISLSFVYYIK